VKVSPEDSPAGFSKDSPEGSSEGFSGNFNTGRNLSGNFIRSFRFAANNFLTVRNFASSSRNFLTARNFTSGYRNFVRNLFNIGNFFDIIENFVGDSRNFTSAISKLLVTTEASPVFVETSWPGTSRNFRNFTRNFSHQVS